MKTYYYNLDDGAFIYPSGDRCNVIPELFYQDQTVWRIALRDRKDRPVDISGITAWGAAIDNNYCSGSAPMCRTLSERITADVESGAVEVAIDAATPEFLAAVNGVSVKPAFFELYGLNAVGERVLSLCFEIRTRMTLDPDPSIGGEIPEAIATKNYAAAVAAGSAGAVSATLRGEIDARPTSSGARQIASAVVQSGGYVKRTEALTSGAAIDTIIGGSARLTVASGGIIRLAVGSMSGETFVSSASLVVSSGAVVVDGQFRTGGGDADIGGDVTAINVSAYSVNANANVSAGGNVAAGESVEAQVDVNAGGNVNAGGSMTAGGRPVLTELATSTDTTTTSASFPVLSGGTSYVYTQPLTNLDIASITSDCRAEFDFTAASGAQIGLPSGGGVKLAGSSSLDSGTHYWVAVNGARVVVVPYIVIGE